ncbi:MAG TPA: PqqD family protein [Candidatus Angelobacter sp.]|nr:PqqD family protein [Candidatus Angelobacter sp.]
MAGFTGDFSLQIPSSIKETASEDGGVLLDIDRGICFSLNSVGLKIWESLKEGCSIDQIAEKLRREYSISYEQAFADLRTFIEQLQSSGLVGDRPCKKSRGVLARFWRKSS